MDTVTVQQQRAGKGGCKQNSLQQVIWQDVLICVFAGWQAVNVNIIPHLTGVGGTLVGAALSVLQQGPFLRYAFGTAASWVICVGGFAGATTADHQSTLFPKLVVAYVYCHCACSLSRDQ